MSLIACKNCGKNVSDLAETCPHCGRKIKGDIKMYSETIYNLFTEALTNRLDFNFEEDKEEGTIVVPNLGIDSSMKSINVIINVRDSDCVILGIYNNSKISSDNMDKVSELLMRINNKYIYPQLILEYENQCVVCRHRSQFSGDLINSDIAALSFIYVCSHLEKFGNAIMAVSLGLQSPEEALKLIDDDD